MSTVLTAVDFLKSMQGETTCIGSIGDFWGHNSNDQVVDDVMLCIFELGHVGELKELCIYDERISNCFYKWLNKNRPNFDVDEYYFITSPTRRLFLLVWEGDL